MCDTIKDIKIEMTSLNKKIYCNFFKNWKNIEILYIAQSMINNLENNIDLEIIYLV